MAENIVEPGGLNSGNTRAAKAIEPSFRNALPHFLPLAIFPLIILALIHGGWWIAAPFAFFMLAGPLDIAFGDDERNMDPANTPERKLFWHNLPVWFWAFLWPPTLVFGLWQILAAGQFSVWECILLAVVLTGEAQAVFIVGHELIHRRATWERRLGEFLLASASYPQYATEHVYIHHALVGTPLDVGSAPRGQSFWQYFPREVASNLTGSWRVVRERLARRRLPIWHYCNPFWRYGIETGFWYALIYWMGGLWAVLAYAVLCLGTVFSMKISNYMQHYGLRRVRLRSGRFEKVRPRHSWNANYKFSNWMFYNMQRHPDHHAVASRPYPLLQNRGADESPQLPGSYARMFNLAVRPKRWFETMDPLVDRWRAQFYPEIEDWSAYDSPVSTARPEAFDAIVEIFAAAPHLAGWIERHPELLDSLQDREFTDLDLPKGFGPDPEAEAIARQGLTRLYWTHEFGVAEMKERIAETPVQDVRDTVETLRNWSNDKAFQIGMHTLRGNLTPIEAGTALSNLAEASISAVLSSVAEQFAGRLVPGSGGGVAAAILGDPASRETAPGAALEILFVYEGGSDDSYDGLCWRFHDALRELSRDSLIFAPIPGSRKGRPVRSLTGFAEHCRTAAPASELLELTRARCIFEHGAAGIGERFDQARREALAAGAARGRLIAELHTAGNGDAGTGLAAYENMRGGLFDVERAARLLQLVLAGDAPDDPAPAAASVFRAAAAQGKIADGPAADLADAAALWRNLHGAQRLVAGDGVQAEALGSSARDVLAQSCGQDDFDALDAAAGETAARAAAVIGALDATADAAAGPS
ncbi:MAG: fatty acid desaturase [Rhodospirillaceae bacterium]|nr:fatty acid desaturase [Rhodospirillaceae bacterium]